MDKIFSEIEKQLKLNKAYFVINENKFYYPLLAAEEEKEYYFIVAPKSSSGAEANNADENQKLEIASAAAIDDAAPQRVILKIEDGSVEDESIIENSAVITPNENIISLSWDSIAQNVNKVYPLQDLEGYAVLFSKEEIVLPDKYTHEECLNYERCRFVDKELEIGKDMHEIILDGLEAEQKYYVTVLAIDEKGNYQQNDDY